MAIDEEMAKELLQKRAQVIEEPNEVEYVQETTGGENPIVTSLGKSKNIQDKLDRREETRNMAGDIGWKNIPIGNLPSKGQFYPAGTQLTIRAATVQEIRHFSTIEEEDLIDIDDKLNFIMEKCVRVKFSNGITTFKDLLEVDRFAIIFAVRELTFKDGENKLQMTINCNQCGNSDVIEISKYNFDFFTLDEKLQRFYNSENRSLTLTTKSGDVIELFIPTLGVTNWIKNFVRNKRQKNEYFDTAFLKISPFLFSDWKRLSEQSYDAMNQKSFTWDVKKMSIVVGVIDLLQKSIDPNIKHSCNSCGAEVSSPISFQGGIKGLFLYSDIFDELV